MNGHRRDLLRREPVLVLLLGLTAASAVVAAVLGRDIVTALVGALLVVVYWLLESAFSRLAERGSIQRAMMIGAIGTLTRIVVVVGGLVIVALVDRPGLVEAIVSFVVVYTVYLAVRLWRYALGAERPSGGLVPTRHHRSVR